MRLEHVIFQWVLALVAGTFLGFLPLRTTEVGPRYFWYHGLGALALLWGTYALCGRAYVSSLPLLLTIAGTGVSLGYFWTLRDRRPKLSFFLLALTTLVLFTGLAWDQYQPETGWPLVFNGALSAAVLGLTLGAMLLGHWYLIQPTLSIDELKKLTLLLIVVLIVRGIYGTWGIGHSLSQFNEVQLYRYLFASTPGLFSLMRWLWGIAAPLALSLMVWKTVKIRSTQSATGILYVVVLCAFSGEILSFYLAIFHGLPY